MIAELTNVSWSVSNHRFPVPLVENNYIFMLHLSNLKRAWYCCRHVVDLSTLINDISCLISQILTGITYHSPPTQLRITLNSNNSSTKHQAFVIPFEYFSNNIHHRIDRHPDLRKRLHQRLALIHVLHTLESSRP